jgi:hypothetical protein
MGLENRRKQQRRGEDRKIRDSRETQREREREREREKEPTRRSARRNDGKTMREEKGRGGYLFIIGAEGEKKCG